MERFDWRPVPGKRTVAEIATAARSKGHLTTRCGGVLYILNGRVWLQFMILDDVVKYRRVPGNNGASPTTKPRCRMATPTFTCDVCGRLRKLMHLMKVVYIGGHGYCICDKCFDDGFEDRVKELTDGRYTITD